jgi:serine/threonine protein kinase
MTDPKSDLDTLERAARIDSLCDRFEAAWLAGERPTPAEFLRAVGVDPASVHPDLVRELARVEAAYRAAEGRPGQASTVTDAPGVLPSTTQLGGGGIASEDGAPPSVPGYVLLGEVGRGGMGVVYRARDRSLARDVAVKLLLDYFPADSTAARRFLEEARITAQLQHPGIPAVHQAGLLPGGRPFLAMKLIKGQTLDELLKTWPDPAADRGRFVAVFESVCQAVGYAHAHRVVHRDLKPSNVMVGAFGEVQVMDWGLAKVLTDRGVDPPGPGDHPGTPPGTEISPTRGSDEETQPGSLLGTPAFMPPEQAIGAVDRVDERSDVFGLGAVLCVILTGRPPYVADTAESTRQLAALAKLDDAHARLAACGAEPELVALCERCLAPEQADRPEDAGAVAKAVADLRAAAEERARRAELERVEAEAEARGQRKRRRVQLALAGTIGLLLLGGGAFAWWQDQQATARRVEAKNRDRDEQTRQERNGEAVEVLCAQCEDA